jgi:hypothetical protein
VKRSEPRGLRIGTIAAICLGIAQLISMLMITSNLDAITWNEAHDTGNIGVAAGIALLLGIIATVSWLTSKMGETQPGALSNNVAPLALGRAESATWVGTARSRFRINLLVFAVATIVCVPVFFTHQTGRWTIISSSIIIASVFLCSAKLR